jgi:hypothetical protein
LGDGQEKKEGEEAEEEEEMETVPAAPPRLHESRSVATFSYTISALCVCGLCGLM